MEIGNGLQVEGNQGGDFLEIVPLNDNLIKLRVGNCCVVTVNYVVPIELITSTLTKLFIKHAQDGFAEWEPGWPEDFTEQLREQIVPL